MHKKSIWRKVKQQGLLHLFTLPGTALLVIFVIFPIIGLWMGFSAFHSVYGKGYFGSLFSSEVVGFYYFYEVFSMPAFQQAMFNTVLIALIKIVTQTVLGIVLALLLNEVMQSFLKKLYQSVFFMPFFLSWTILGTLIIQILSLDGLVNSIFGTETMFLMSNFWFRPVLVITDLWKNAGYQAIYFLAAITSIDASQYEAARIDGANKFKQCWHITIPGIMPIIILCSVLNLGNIMNAGFEQVLMLMNDVVRGSGDIIDTLAYRIGLVSDGIDRYSYATAIGLFKSLISCGLFIISYLFAAKKLNYSIL